MPVGNLEEFPNDINDNSFFLQTNFFPSKKNQFRFMSKYMNGTKTLFVILNLWKRVNLLWNLPFKTYPYFIVIVSVICAEIILKNLCRAIISTNKASPMNLLLTVSEFKQINCYFPWKSLENLWLLLMISGGIEINKFA